MNLKCIQKQQVQIGNNIVLKNAKQRGRLFSHLRYIFEVHFSVHVTMPHLNTNFSLYTIIVAVVCNALGNHHTSVTIFLEESNSDVQDIALNAVDRYSKDNKHGSLESQANLNFSFVSYRRTVKSIFNLHQDHSTSLRFAIFVHVSSHEIVLSSIMKSLNILPIGLFQTDGIRITQVRLNYLTVFFFNPILPPTP